MIKISLIWNCFMFNLQRFMKNIILNSSEDNLICFCGKSGKLNKTCDGSDWSCVTDFLKYKKKNL